MFVRLPSGAVLNLDQVAVVIVKRKDEYGRAVARVYVPGLEHAFAEFVEDDAEALATWTSNLVQLKP